MDPEIFKVEEGGEGGEGGELFGGVGPTDSSDVFFQSLAYLQRGFNCFSTREGPYQYY